MYIKALCWRTHFTLSCTVSFKRCINKIAIITAIERVTDTLIMMTVKGKYK